MYLSSDVASKTKKGEGENKMISAEVLLPHCLLFCITDFENGLEKK